MAKPYSQDLRGRLVRAVLAGQSRRKAARGFDVSASCVIKLMQQFATTGGCLPQKFGGHKRHALGAHEDKVRALVAAQPDLTITELWSKLTALEIKVGRSAVGRFLRHLQLTFKNVWPAPSASDFIESAERSVSFNVSGLGSKPRAKMEIRAFRSS